MRKNIEIIFVVFVSVVIVLIYLVLCFGAYMYPLKYKNYIINYAEQYNVDCVLVASVINVESGFDKNAVSPKGAKGLMQITDKTAIWLCEKLKQDYDPQKLFDAEFNIKLGVYYMSYLLEKFDDVNTALASYNAGEGIVKVWLQNKSYSLDGKKLDNIPYKETDEYIKKVQTNLKRYQKRL